MKNKGKLCKCGEEIHPKRLKALPNTTTCVSCSNVGKKGAITVTKGEGEDTYNEVIIMNHEEVIAFNKLKLAENKLLGHKSRMDFDEEEPISK